MKRKERNIFEVCGFEKERTNVDVSDFEKERKKERIISFFLSNFFL